MNYIVLDLEFNQPFPFKTGEQTILNPECPFEIIQIGAVKLDETLTIQPGCQFNAFIKPEVYKRIHPFVEKITGITNQTLIDCPNFPTAYASFLEFIGTQDWVICTWGVDDVKSLFKNLLYYNLDTNQTSNKYINIQQYATKYLNYEAGKNIGLKNAVTELSLPVNLDFHNALYDALYTAQVFQVVHPKTLSYDTFNLLDLAKKKPDRKGIDAVSLLSHFEKKLDRSLSDEEAYLIKAAYKLGRNQVFDFVLKKNYKNGRNKKN